LLNGLRGMANVESRESNVKRSLRRRATYEEVLDAEEHIRGIKYDEFMLRRGDWGRPLLLWGLRVGCGMTLAQIGQRTGGQDYAAVHDMIKDS